MRFERFAASYARLAEFQRVQAVQLAQDFGPSGIGIDLGSGTGFMVQAMPDVEMIAVDLSPAMLSHNPSQNRLVADGRQLPIASQSLDFGVSNMALQWMGDCDEFLRVLKPGAPYRVSIVVDGSWPELAAARHSAGLNQPFVLPAVEHWQQQFESAGTLQVHQVDFDTPDRLWRLFEISVRWAWISAIDEVQLRDFIRPWHSPQLQDFDDEGQKHEANCGGRHRYGYW